jgi:hypothetical protein
LRTIRTVIATCTGSNDDEIKMTTIHVGDLRWIHRELSDCQERLAALTKIYRPPFRFRRYRAALLLAQQQQRDERQEKVPVATTNADTPFLEGDGIMGSPANSTKEEAQVVNDDPRRLSCFDGATLHVSDDGQLYVNGATLSIRTVTSGAIVLADLTNCTIHLYVCLYIISHISQITWPAHPHMYLFSFSLLCLYLDTQRRRLSQLTSSFGRSQYRPLHTRCHVPTHHQVSTYATRFAVRDGPASAITRL